MLISRTILALCSILTAHISNQEKKKAKKLESPKLVPNIFRQSFEEILPKLNLAFLYCLYLLLKRISQSENSIFLCSDDHVSVTVYRSVEVHAFKYYFSLTACNLGTSWCLTHTKVVPPITHSHIFFLVPATVYILRKKILWCTENNTLQPYCQVIFKEDVQATSLKEKYTPSVYIDTEKQIQLH